MTRWLCHAQVRLALHELRGGAGRPLLLLHGLGERSPVDVPAEAAGWSGPVCALDFTGHGESTRPCGGGYTAELLMADADAALAEIGPATLLGRGIGGYVATLLAGGRPQLVRGAVVCDGPGLAGGGAWPRSPEPPIRIETGSDPAVPPDPYALAELAIDVRPPDYAVSFASQAASLAGIDRPISVSATERPDWLAALLRAPGVAAAPADQALARYATC